MSSMNIQQCEHEDCTLDGEYKAPKSRDGHQGYFYFCLNHVRDYNKQWDYFKGMPESEIIQHQIADITWRRPTWTLKDAKKLSSVYEHPFFQTPIGVIKIEHSSGGNAFPKPERGSSAYKAMQTLDLRYPFSSTHLKKHYISLVKTHHPDTNDGCKKSEEKLKKITVAYKVLQTYIARY